jgi:tRNA G18 (ribose-2'-O)-methylase SpoU
MAESAEVIRRAVDAGLAARSVLVARRWLEALDPELRRLGAGPHGPVPVYVGDSGVLESITGFHVHRGAIAAMVRPSLPGVTEVLAGAATSPRSTVVVLEDLVDHTNVGAVFRAAAGLGADAVLVSDRCADPLYRRSVRVSMGTVFQVPWTRLGELRPGLKLLREHAYSIVAVDPGPAAGALTEFAATRPDRLALLLGTEGEGLSTRAKEEADCTVRIPMQRGVDSLNVAAAAAVVLYALTS